MDEKDMKIPVEVSGALDMTDVANRVVKGENIQDLVPPDAVDNLKVFLLVYARSQVTRAIKLTNVLETMEDHLIDEYTRNADKYDANDIMRIIGTITTSLNNAINLIKMVTNDDSFIQLIYNDNRVQTNNNINVVESTVDMSSQESREKVRLLASQLLSHIEKSKNTVEKGD